MTTAKPFYASLTEQLNRRATRAVLGLLGFRNDALREHLRVVFGQEPGSPGSFLADPVFEATFGWHQAPASLADLNASLLHPEVVRALAEPPLALREDYAFPAVRHPYLHQLEAWQALIKADPPRSVLVSSGTGSGKTECFLVPILDDLAKEIERRQGTALSGVRAVFLYPLNALIKSQKDRLVAWSEPFGGRIRFCLYNGDTPEQGKSEWKSEVADRRTLRANPPSILVTNATMLEYLLVRNEDRPILEQSQGNLRWIVIDEAHTYIGSQAAELTLLLRRVLHAFGVNSEQVHFVATSATLGDSSETARRRLAEFLADVAGVPVERISVIEGQRQVPELPKTTNKPRPALETLRSMTPTERFCALAGDRRIRDLRKHIIEQPRTLGELADKLYGKDDARKRRDTLDVLDLCTQAVNDDREPLLPLRGHVFQRALNGLWACANPHCDGRKNSRLDDSRWPFGALYLERRVHCQHCHYPVFELVLCGECGAEYLAAAEVFRDGKDWLEPWTKVENEDEFQQELEPPEAEDDDENPSPPFSQAHPRLLTTADLATTRDFRLLQDGQMEPSGTEGIPVHYCASTSDSEGIRCPVCQEKERPHQAFSLLKPIRVGAPFLLGTAIPALLDHVKPYDKDLNPRPLQGKRLISFTDSRQGTARFAAKLQQESERDYVRSLLYHHVADAAKPADPAQLAKVRDEIAALENFAATNSAIAGVLKQKRQEMAKLSAPPLGRLPWEDAADKLLQNSDFKDWLLPGLRELTFDQLNDRALARLCLLREFFLRPKRQFSLEGLGLLQLSYPALDQAKVPSVFSRNQVSDIEYQQLLHVAIDFHLRGGKSVAISPDTARWLGYPGYPTVQLPPDQSKTRKIQRHWPSAKSPQAARNGLIRLLAFTFELRLDRPDHHDLIHELLAAIWHGILPLLSKTEDGFVVDLEKHAVVTEVRNAWFCPVTRRLLPTIFRDITPYLPDQAPDAMARCRPLEMPRVPNPFWLGCPPEEIEHWLETDPAILQLREVGAWPDLSDRIARHSRYLRAVEHSAQIGGSQLTRREDDFKQGKINLMSCSTTMEMGVDIGGLTGVAMNNVPPHPANFLQRAGRAGRRGETAAFSFTLCKATPHGEAVFRNPLWPFVTRLALPRVEMQSAPIVQRHVNALALATFLREHAPERIRKLNTGWFFESASENESSPCAHFGEWCRDRANQTGIVTDGTQALTRRSVLEGTPVTELLSRVAESAERVAERWHRELNALLDQQQAVHTQDGDSKAEVAIKIQLERMRGEYLLGELATLGFLPGYGFPTDVVPFVTTTLEDVERRQRHDRKEREDNRTWRAGYPSRNLAIAIRDYAPGTDTVVDGRVYRCDGVTLNWHLPPEQEGAPEIQSLRWVWQCSACGGNGIRQVVPERCPHCGKTDVRRNQFLQPTGFAVDLRCKPHNDITTPQYIPVREPLISLEGAEWINLASVGRFRASPLGHVFQHSDGLHGKGYAVCLRCGRADSMTADIERPNSLKDHKRLRGGKLNDRERACPGNDETWAIKDGLLLGAVSWTDVLELQLRNPVNGEPISDKTTAHTLAVALRRALCRTLGIEEDEVGCATLSSRDRDQQPVTSIFLYDTASGGAGYTVQAPFLLPELFREARSVLDCPSKCDSACQSCVLDYGTQHHLEHLDRNKTLALLSTKFLDALALPHTLKAFGADSRLEMETLPQALRRELQHHPANELRIYLGGPAADWEPLDWRLRDDLARLTKSGVKVNLIIPQSMLNTLEDSQRDELAALTLMSAAELWQHNDTPACGNQLVIMELIGEERSARWATTDAAALAPNTIWGNGQKGAQFIRAVSKELLPPLPADWLILSPQKLREPSSSLAEIAITTELDGGIDRFGQSAWSLIFGKSSAVKTRLDGSDVLTSLEYSDRYLRSPLTVLLLRALLAELTGYPGGICTNTQIVVTTSRLERNDVKDPRWLSHDWRDGTDRKQFSEAIFGTVGPIIFREEENSQLPHARILTLCWEDGASWSIRLDQGLGYWRTSNNPRLAPFPFDQTVTKQVTHANNLHFNVESSHSQHPTYWYVCANP